MFRLGSLLASLCFLVVVLPIIVHDADATAVSFTVPAGATETRTIVLAVEDRVAVRFTVVGGQDDSTIVFSMIFPNGTTSTFGQQGSFTHLFVNDRDGTCTLRFSNAGPSQSKLVTLDYEVQHYVLGMPQMLFWAMVVALVCVAMVAVFILMAKPR